MAKKVGIKIELEGNFRGDLKRLGTNSKKAFASVANNAKRASNAVGGLARAMFSLKGALVGLGIGLAVRQFSKLIVEQATLQDEAIKTARALGIQVEQLTALRRSTELGGASAQVLDNGLRKLTRNILDMSKGIGEAKDAFEEMGIEVENTDGTLRTADEVLFDIADGFAATADGSRKSANAQLLFGRAGAQLINTLNGGSKALREQRVEAERLGIIFSEKVAKEAEIFNDALLDMGKALDGGLRELTNTLIPILTPLIKDLTNFIVDNRQGIREYGEAFGEFLNILRKGAPVLEFFGEGFRGFVEVFRGQNIGEARAEVILLSDELIKTKQTIIDLKNASKEGFDDEDVKNYIDSLSKLAVKEKELEAAIKPLQTVLDEAFKREEERAIDRLKQLSDQEAEAILQVQREEARVNSIIAMRQSKLDEENAIKLEKQRIQLEKEEEQERAFQIRNFEEQQRFESKNAALKIRAAQDQQNRLKQEAAFEQQILLQTAGLANNFFKTAFGNNQAFAIADIGIKTAQGVMQALATLPPPFGQIQAGLIAATGAAQVANVRKQKFADGTEFVTGPGTSRSDSVPAMLSVGERVIDASTNQQLEGISNDELVSLVTGGQPINITVNAGAGADGGSIAQMVVNAIEEAKNSGLEPSIV